MIDPYETRKSSVSGVVYRQCDTFFGEPGVLDVGDARAYANDGYLVLPSFFDSEAVAAMASAKPSADALMCMEPSGAAPRSAIGVHEQSPFSILCGNESLWAIAREILGSEVYVHQSRVNFKMPGVGTGWHWHSDFETWHAQDGMPKMRCFTAMIPLTINTQRSGPLMVIPGSHRLYWSASAPEQEFSAEENFADQKEGVPTATALMEIKDRCGGQEIPILCEPGDLVLFDCNLMHGSIANKSASARTNLFVVFNSVENILQEPFSASTRRPIQMAYREESVA